MAAHILAIRLTLQLAVLGAVGLTWLAVEAHDPWRLVAVATYTITVCLPLIWLAGRR